MHIGYSGWLIWGPHIEVACTTKDFKVPIPCKLLGLHEALEKNFEWICPENFFDENSVLMAFG
jgi:hypothetical protein